MSVEKRIELHYREKGKAQTLPVTVSFVSNWSLREFHNILAGAQKIQTAWDELSDVNTLIAAGKKEKQDVSGLQQKARDLVNYIGDFESEDFISRREKLIMQILEDNGVEDEKFFNAQFYDKNVEPGEIMRFLTQAVWKDFEDEKKKAM